MKQLIFSVLMFSCFASKAQLKKTPTDADRLALEGIIVETYNGSELKDYKDTLDNYLPKGSVTYRIFVDLKPGYTMQAVFGIAKHELKIETTTEFFNAKRSGERTGDRIDNELINQNLLALDSWLTIGAATKAHLGIPKTDDKDGSIITKSFLSKADGLIASEKVRAVSYFGDDLKFFQDSTKASSFKSTNVSWAVFGGVKGATADNKILIAQLTTNGKLSYELNLQIGTPTGASMQYVAKDAEGAEIKFDALNSKK